MDRGNLADLTAFVAVADRLSFRAAASQLGVTPSALSHSMRQLEDRLGVRLLNRTTRSVSVTDAGLRLLEQLRPAIDQIAGAIEELNETRQRPMGRLRIYALHLAAAAVIAPIWERFLSTYPEVHLELAVGEAPIDLVAKGFDAGIGPRERAPADMIAVRVMGPMKVAVVGAPAYFARRRPPRAPDDLAQHSCIQFRRAGDGTVFVWPFERNRQSRRLSVDGRVMVNDPDLAVRAAVDGLGIAYTIEALAEPFLRSGQLVRVLEDWSPTVRRIVPVLSRAPPGSGHITRPHRHDPLRPLEAGQELAEESIYEVLSASRAWKVRPGTPLQRCECPQLLARDFAEVLEQIDSGSALHQFMQFANRLARCKVGVDCCPHDLLGARDGSRRRLEPHPADHGVEGNEFLNVWLVAHNGFTVCLRCRGNELPVEVVAARHFAGELDFPCVRTLAQPGRGARRQAADNRSGKRR